MIECCQIDRGVPIPSLPRSQRILIFRQRTQVLSLHPAIRNTADGTHREYRDKVLIRLQPAQTEEFLQWPSQATEFEQPVDGSDRVHKV